MQKTDKAATSPDGGSSRKSSRKPGRKRRGAMATAFSLLTAGAAAFTAAPAHADLPGDAYIGQNTIRNWETGQCLQQYYDSNRGVNGVLAGGCNASDPGQQWAPLYLFHDTNDVVQLYNVGLGECLTTYYNNGAYLDLEPCNSSRPEQWFDANPNPGHAWDQVAFELDSSPGNNLGLCIENNAGLEVNLEGCHNDPNYGRQIWKFGY